MNRTEAQAISPKVQINKEGIDLAGVIDMHVHTAPDVRPRKMNDIQLAQAARQAGMQAILIKSHHTLTADRARIAEYVVNSIQVFGGLALNSWVGGLNPGAVEAALAMGARQVWMPTLSSVNQMRYNRDTAPGISILDGNGNLLPAVLSILALIAEKDIILGTGHLAVNETIQLVQAARQLKVKKILVTHPELPLVNMPVEVQEMISGEGVFFERCLISVVSYPESVTFASLAATLRRIGVESSVLATDFGQANNPSPVDGMRYFLAHMQEQGFSSAELDRMTKTNPKQLLDIP
jgi:hypothetical protein